MSPGPDLQLPSHPDLIPDLLVCYIFRELWEFEVSLLPYLLLFSSLMLCFPPLVNEGVEIVTQLRIRKVIS